ncbi:hypothetical protein [Leptothoe spongobia]|uniref:Uncharacterized protein n=1 Tax=Leptothoe spongobia TAU-MAC 1115 TaxID=1967444 RepID=A0A947DI14_9CYAN|nr:hypothetical protein [Leptothoe spongobia]MBT9316920.1 hypothetical protein [Leptothoe spongobia TAU-MAC 1115]
MNLFLRLATSILLVLVLWVTAMSPVIADSSDDPGYPYLHPHPQPLIQKSKQITAGDTTYIKTGDSLFEEVDPFDNPPGSNFLPTIYTDVFDSSGNQIPNTLPSTPRNFYNLHDGEPSTSKINPTSPTNDLNSLFIYVANQLCQAAGASSHVRDICDTNAELAKIETENQAAFMDYLVEHNLNDSLEKVLQFGLDILEGSPIADRTYSGFPLLHYTGPNKVKTVELIKDADGHVVGGNVNVHQLWYNDHIESDTGLIDPSQVLEIPWTITYTVDILNRGHDDFSPFVMYTDDPAVTDPDWQQHLPGKKRKALVGMDQSFFPMEDGTRTVFTIKMAPSKYYNLVYTWGWRMHPPRIQVMDNALKSFRDPITGEKKTLVEWETSVFGENPTESEEAKLAAIAQIGDLSPAKRMWTTFRDILAAYPSNDPEQLIAQLEKGKRAFQEWQTRTQLPCFEFDAKGTCIDGVNVDPESDLTLMYINNTTYGQLTQGGWVRWPDWKTRGAKLKVTLLNGDYFDHGYQNVDFGGARGWENQFKSSTRVGGSGCWFTFGRAYWWKNLTSPVRVPAANPVIAPNTPGMHKVNITYNYEPSTRLRFYQFDPWHHDVAIYSVH